MTEPQWVGGGELGEIAYLKLPGRAGPFRRRAERLAELAPASAAGDFLAFLSRLAAAQARAAEQLRVPAPAGDLPAARPLGTGGGPLPEWREALALLVRDLQDAAMPAPAREALAELGRRGAGELDALAGRILRAEVGAADLAAAPFAGAALQVAWALRAAALPAALVARADDPGCPVCGFPPVAGTVMGGDKLRYLACGLCATEWHLTRVQCAVCRSGAQLHHLALDAGGPAKAEACDACHAYTKLLYAEVAPGLDPCADDLATLALDLLVAERGYLRNGRNLYLATAAE